MLMRLLTSASVAVGSLLLAGIVIFGGDFTSYVARSAEGVRAGVTGSEPIEYELQHARELLDGMLPEIHAKIRRAAHEEIEVEALKQRIRVNEQQLAERGRQLRSMRRAFDDSSALPPSSFHRARKRNQLRIAFQRYQEAEKLLASQRELFAARENSLQAVLQGLEQQRSKKQLIEQQIETLAARHRLQMAQSAQAPLDLEPGQLARIDELLREVESRMQVTSRLREYESKMSPIGALVVLDDRDFVAEVEGHLRGPDRGDAEDTSVVAEHQSEATRASQHASACMSEGSPQQ